jgi:hypothetical protein
MYRYNRFGNGIGGIRFLESMDGLPVGEFHSSHKVVCGAHQQPLKNSSLTDAYRGHLLGLHDHEAPGRVRDHHSLITVNNGAEWCIVAVEGRTN